MPLHTFSKADKATQWWDDNFSWALMDLNCGVIHTTETTGWPGYNNGSMAPTVTAKPDIPNKVLRFRQHFYDEHSSRALVNLAGGVSTNTANAIQIELIGTCDDRYKTSWGTKKAGIDYIHWPTAPDWALKGLAEWMVYLYKTHGIPLKSGLSFKTFDPSRSLWGEGARMSFDQWRAFTGWCGHQHVPENTHGDPGSFPVQKVLDMAKAMLGGATPAAPAAPAPAPAPAPATKTMTNTTLRSNFTNVAQGGQVTLTANVTPAVEGTFRFIWKKADGTWAAVASAPAANGKGVVTNVPWATVRYGVQFFPKDATKYTESGAASIVVEVIDLKAALEAVAKPTA